MVRNLESKLVVYYKYEYIGTVVRVRRLCKVFIESYFKRGCRFLFAVTFGKVNFSFLFLLSLFVIFSSVLIEFFRFALFNIYGIGGGRVG